MGHRSQHTGASLNPVSHLDPQNRARRNDNIDSGAELDQSHALPTLDRLPFIAAKDDAPRKEPGNLLEGDFIPRVRALAAHGDCVLLVALGRGGVHGIEELAFLIAHAAQDAADGGAVHMDIKNTEEDADPLPRTFGGRDGSGFGNQAVAGRNNQAVAGRNCALRIAEEPEEKRSQQDRGHAPDPLSCNPAERRSHCQQAQPVDVTVANHRSQRLYGD